MKNLKQSVLTLFAFILLTSCGPQLSTKKMTSKDLSNYKTFAYLPNTNFEVANQSNAQRDKVASSVIESLNNNMMEAGYTMDKQSPDVLVLLTTKYDTEYMRDVDAEYVSYPYNYNDRYTYNAVSPYYSNYYYTNYYNYGEYVDYDVDYSQYKEGTLIVDIIDRKTKEKLWTGTAEQAIFNSDTSQEVAMFVEELFDEYPTNN